MLPDSSQRLGTDADSAATLDGARVMGALMAFSKNSFLLASSEGFYALGKLARTHVSRGLGMFPFFGDLVAKFIIPLLGWYSKPGCDRSRTALATKRVATAETEVISIRFVASADRHG